MKVKCKTCNRFVGVTQDGRTVQPNERVVVKHRMSRSPRRLRTVLGTRGGKGFSEHRPINRQEQRYVPAAVCGGSGRIIKV
jgi:hypothetical protein